MMEAGVEYQGVSADLAQEAERIAQSDATNANVRKAQAVVAQTTRAGQLDLDLKHATVTEDSCRLVMRLIAMRRDVVGGYFQPGSNALVACKLADAREHALALAEEIAELMETSPACPAGHRLGSLVWEKKPRAIDLAPMVLREFKPWPPKWLEVTVMGISGLASLLVLAGAATAAWLLS